MDVLISILKTLTLHVTLTQSNYISHEILHVELRENMVSDLNRI